ncbi:hypothetical protein D9Q98_003289 [Chlorella vulgaris]|uniref:Uncharacterized protein n=1 Tax=Chlorella vulgaris TaxID=3077 RepID=A0A9D4TSG7_CHLVU|nr:hypothetical protein D9Q98_003289 [Chlorella vulgaris]
MTSAAVHGVGAILLLCCSNAFMTTAWYLHLKFKSWSIIKAIFISWAIAFGEYCLQVPANRMGHFSHGGPFTAPQLKIIQEFISLTAFAIFSVAILKEKLRWVDLGAFILICSGVALGMVGKPADQQALPPPPPPQLEAPAPEPGGRRLLLMQPWLAIKGGKRSSSNHSTGTGTGSEVQESPPSEPAGLPHGALHATHMLRGTPSAQVLVAGDAAVHIASSQQDVRRRDPTPDVEAGSGRDSAGEEAPATQDVRRRDPTPDVEAGSATDGAGEEAPVTQGAVDAEGLGGAGSAAQEVDVRSER